MSPIAPVVGIDLGTTYSCIAYYQNDEARIILNKEEKPITASYVSFNEYGYIIGDKAKNTRDYENTLFGIKNIIGRYYTDPEVKVCKSIYPYSIIDKNGKPKLSIKCQNENLLLAPEEISAMILRKLKDDATNYFGKEVKRAVITVPAHFSDAQRQSTKNAGIIAGLEVMKIINEPTAAALAYGIKNTISSEQIILVYDLGGGTFDVSIIYVKDGIFEVKVTNGISHLGGDQIDENLMYFCAQEFQNQHSLDLTQDKIAMRRLCQCSEKVKKVLSTENEADFELDELYEGEDFEYILTRTKFVELNFHIFQKTIECVKNTIKAAEIEYDKIDEILLIGGSSRIPEIQKMLKDLFNKELNASLNPDEAVAMGAAIEAAILDGESSNKIKEMLLYDVCPLSLGLRTERGIMDVIIPRNTRIPVEESKQYKTTEDNQTTVDIVVYEGEGHLVEQNVKLGEFTISGIPMAPKGIVKFVINFKVNADGIFEVSASGFGTGTERNFTIDRKTSYLSEKELLKMKENAEKYERSEDETYSKVL